MGLTAVGRKAIEVKVVNEPVDTAAGTLPAGHRRKTRLPAASPADDSDLRI